MGSDITDFKKLKPVKAIRDPKKFIGKQFKNPFEVEFPEVPEPPEAPEFDAAVDEQLKNALISRIRRKAIRGKGIQDTIKTSPLGVTKRAPVVKQRLTGE